MSDTRPTPSTRNAARGSDDPFAVLGLAPTLDPAEVKRAYFAALQAHPPHADPQGFRRIRAAYEVLTGADALAAAYLAAPFDPAAERARFSELEQRLAEAGRRHLEANPPRIRRTELLRHLSSSTCKEAIRHFPDPT